MRWGKDIVVIIVPLSLLPFLVLTSLILAGSCLGLACLLSCTQMLYPGKGTVPVHRLVLISLVSDVSMYAEADLGPSSQPGSTCPLHL